MPAVTIVADDLSGAADCGLAFRRHGLSTAVGLSAAAVAGDPATVHAVDTDTRGGDPAAAAAAVRDAVGRSAGAVLYKKLDSTLRGHIGEEVAAALAASGLGLAVVAPAFPAQGRTTAGGRAVVRGVPVEGRADVVELLGAAGVHAELGALDELAARRDGVRALVLDAETDEDLRAIVRAVGDRSVLWVGSAGLAGQLAAALDLPADPVPDTQGADGPVLIAVGTGAPVAREQVCHMAERGTAVIELGPADAPARAAAALDGGADVVLVAHEAEEVAAAAAALADRIGGLVATGGDTARAVVRALGASVLHLHGEVEPGVPYGRMGDGPGLPVVTKAGGFGGPATLEACRRHLHRDEDR